MQAVHRSEDINEGTAGAAGEVKTSGRKLAPNKKLSSKKQHAENGSEAEPGEVALIAERDTGQRSNRGERSFPRDSTPRQLDRDAAENEDSGIDQQWQPWQSHGRPSLDVSSIAQIKTDEPAANQVDSGKRNEQHNDGRHGDGQPHPGATQALAIIRNRVWHEVRREVGQSVVAVPATAVISTASTAARRERGAVVAGGARREGSQSGHELRSLCRLIGAAASRGLNSKRMSSSLCDNERERWNRKYREAIRARTETGRCAKTVPDPFFLHAFSEYILPRFPHGGRALDLAGGAGRHAIWLAQRGWTVRLIDVSEAGVELARQNAGPLASHISFVVDDLTHFEASQTQFKMKSEMKTELKSEAGFDVVMVFFYLERKIFPEVVKAVRPGGLLLYKTYTEAQTKLPAGPKNPAHLLEPGELPRLAAGLRVVHYREESAERATAELVASKEIPTTRS